MSLQLAPLLALAITAAPPIASSYTEKQTPPDRADAVPERSIQAKLRADLGSVLARSRATDLVPVTIVMRRQASREEIMSARSIADKASRRAYVVERLKAVARESQGPLVDLLRRRQAMGLADRVNPMWIHNVIGARVTPAVAYEIAARPDVAYLNHDRPAGPEVLAGFESAGAAGPQDAVECGVSLMRAPDVWSEFGIRGERVLVGVIDTGVCLTHPDIADHIWTNPGEIPDNRIDDDGNGYVDDIHGWNWENDNNDVNDLNGHGSHVAGTVAGDGTQGTQAGMAPGAEIMVLKFWNSFSGEQTVWDAMEYGTANGADILTASLGWPHFMNPDRVTWRTICENSMAAGVVVTYAAHNYGCYNPPDDVTTPGDVPDMITVGATDCSDVKASFSSCGPVTWEGIQPWNDWPYPPGKLKPTVSAPGVFTLSHDFCSGYSYKSGTSMATPHVAGAMALMLQANPTLDHWDCKQILKDTAVDLGAPGPDNQVGHGRVDAYEAVVAAMNRLPLVLTLSGACPGELTATAFGATAGDRIALVYGFTEGTGPSVPGCPGLQVDLTDAKRFDVVTADATGRAEFRGTVPPSACGTVHVQAVNLDACEKSVVLTP